MWSGGVNTVGVTEVTEGSQRVPWTAHTIKFGVIAKSRKNSQNFCGLFIFKFN